MLEFSDRVDFTVETHLEGGQLLIVVIKYLHRDRSPGRRVEGLIHPSLPAATDHASKSVARYRGKALIRTAGCLPDSREPAAFLFDSAQQRLALPAFLYVYRLLGMQMGFAVNPCFPLM